MEYNQTDDQFLIDYTAHNQFFVGAWFATLGILTVIFSVFLADESITLLVTIGIICSLIGGLLCLLTPRLQTIASKDKQTIVVRTSYYMHSHQKDTLLLAQDVAKVKIVSLKYDAEANNKGKVVYLTLDNGKALKIAAQHSYGSLFDKKRVSEQDINDCAEKLAQFLNVPIDKSLNEGHNLDS